MFQGLTEEDLCTILFQGLKLVPGRDFLIVDFQGKNYKITAQPVNEREVEFKIEPVDVSIRTSATILKAV